MNSKHTRLVLGRKIGESIEIHAGQETIIITVEEILGRQVRISVVAAPFISIWRQELLEEVDQK